MGAIQYKPFNGVKFVSALLTFTAMVIAITPLCGVLFGCGCDWPWAGLDEKCNYYRPHAVHICPWCASKFAGVLSVGLAWVAGIGTAVSWPLAKMGLRPVYEAALRIMIGLSAFLTVAAAAAVLSAQWSDYPMRQAAAVLTGDFRFDSMDRNGLG